MLPPPRRCAFPGCEEFPMHNHHITYNPEVKKPLCVAHHEEITIINGIQGRKFRTSLSNKHHWWIWYQWIEGKLKPRKTRNAMEYIEDMRRGPERVVRVLDVKPTLVPKPQEPAVRRRRKPRTKKKSSRRRTKLGKSPKAARRKSKKHKSREQ